METLFKITPWHVERYGGFSQDDLGKYAVQFSCLLWHICETEEEAEALLDHFHKLRHPPFRILPVPQAQACDLP